LLLLLRQSNKKIKEFFTGKEAKKSKEISIKKNNEIDLSLK